MRSSVITNEISKKHFVENYRFKVLGSDVRQAEPTKIQENIDEPNVASDEVGTPLPEAQKFQPQNFSENTNPQPQSGGFDASFVEELLKKTDELSTNIVKLQMQIENQEAEFNRRLEAEIARAKEDGKSEGLAEAEVKFQDIVSELNERFSSSIAKISAKFDSLDEFLTKNEEELATTAIGIAKEIVKTEISQNSSKVAYSLSKSLLDDIKDARDITLRVNPNDSEYLKEQFGSKKHIKIESDDAISKGGVVIISETGNIDATLQTRFEKLKSLVE